jgi:peroxiredoxin
VVDSSAESLQNAPVTPLRWGQAAPEFELPASTGRSISLREYRGRDVVLGFYCYDFGGI